MKDTPEIPADWLAEFEAAARRPLEQRMKYAFIRTYKPVLDDAKYRAFDTMADYRKWCEENLPSWLGYGRVAKIRETDLPLTLANTRKKAAG